LSLLCCNNNYNFYFDYSYKQGLHGANIARSLASKHNFPFTRPSDYFAEMVKSDSHMERIRQRLLDETAAIKKSEDKRKEREGKKYGKQVQIEKIKEREKSKKDMEVRLKGLKRSKLYIRLNNSLLFTIIP
jgi:rRNA-processing protein EBP2